MDARETRISYFKDSRETPPTHAHAHPRANDTPATPTHKKRKGAPAQILKHAFLYTALIYLISQYLDKARLLRTKLSARQACNVQGASKQAFRQSSAKKSTCQSLNLTTPPKGYGR